MQTNKVPRDLIMSVCAMPMPMITHLTWTLLNVSSNNFCFRCTDNAFSALEISSKW